MKETNDEIIRNFFTKYVNTAMTRARKDYIKKEQSRNVEETGELEVMYDLAANEVDKALEEAFMIPLEAEPVRKYLRLQADELIEKALLCLTDFELVLVFAKVFRQLTFTEIGLLLEIDWKKAAAAYSYAHIKLRKELEKNGI